MCDLTVFNLRPPDPGESVDDVSVLVVYAHEWSRSFHKVEISSVLSYPLVYDTRESSGLTTFKSDF